jgi:Na+-driven multidrug efflux pump
MSSLGFRIPLAILFGVVLDKGMFGLGLAAPAATLGAGSIMFIYYLSGKWKNSTVVEKKNEAAGEGSMSEEQ